MQINKSYGDCLSNEHKQLLYSLPPSEATIMIEQIIEEQTRITDERVRKQVVDDIVEETQRRYSIRIPHHIINQLYILPVEQAKQVLRNELRKYT